MKKYIILCCFMILSANIELVNLTISLIALNKTNSDEKITFLNQLKQKLTTLKTWNEQDLSKLETQYKQNNTPKTFQQLLKQEKINQKLLDKIQALTEETKIIENLEAKIDNKNLSQLKSEEEKRWQTFVKNWQPRKTDKTYKQFKVKSTSGDKLTLEQLEAKLETQKQAMLKLAQENEQTPLRRELLEEIKKRGEVDAN